VKENLGDMAWSVLSAKDTLWLKASQGFILILYFFIVVK
jgi:hypothetical protein